MKKHIARMVWMMLALASCSAGTPSGLGVKDGRLAPCPASPNCVSSEARDPKHAMDPIPYNGSPEQARERLRGVILSMPRAKIVSDTGDYVHAEFKSRIMRFVDDVEFVFDDGRSLIRFRSASRVGYSDMGANRKRMEEIRRRYESTPEE